MLYLRFPARLIDLSSTSLKTLKIRGVGTKLLDLSPLLSLKNKLLKLTSLLMFGCVIVLMNLAPSITEFHLEYCKVENSEIWKTGHAMCLNNIQHLTLRSSRYGQNNVNIVNLMYQQCHKHLTYLKLDRVDLSLLAPQPGDLPCLTSLTILNPQEKTETIAVLFACRSSLVDLHLDANGLMFYDEHCKQMFPELKKVKLHHIPIGILLKA